MKLDEVTSTIDKMTLETAVHLLMKKGYRVLGNGTYAKVLHKKGSPYAVKLFSKYDRGYARFYEYCKKNWQIDPHLPRVYGIGKYLSKFVAVRIEVLSEDTPDGFEELAQMLQLYSEDPDFIKPRYAENLADVEKQQPGILATIDNLRSIPNVSWDLHDQNVMMRGDTMVITDPFVAK